VRIVELPGHSPGSIGALVGNALLSGDAVACAAEAASGELRHETPKDERARQSLSKALSLADIIYPGHDRPFHVGTPPTYLDDYTIKIRFFTDPSGPDEELQIASLAAKSFASWP